MPEIPVLIIVFMSLLLYSCSDEQSVSAALGEVPDTVSDNFRQVTVSSTGRVEISAGKVEHYSKSDTTVFMDAGMTEFNSSLEKTVEGSADRIVLTGDRDGFAEGGIVLEDLAGDMRLEAEHLTWDNKQKLLVGEGKVRIASGDGIEIIGEGFSADTARESYSFSKGVEGTLEISDEG